VVDAGLYLVGINAGFGEPLHKGWPAPIVAPGTTSEGANLPSLASRLIHSPLLSANIVSITRLMAGFGISIILGAIIGMMMWQFKPLDDFLGPAFLGLQTLPSVCWAPLAILCFGLNESAILFVLVMGSTFAIAISMRDGLRAIPPLYRRAGLMMGAGGWKLYRYVMLPASLPALASSLRQGFSFAWRSLMGAELFLPADHHGLGFLLQNGQNTSDIATVVAVMIVMVLIGMLADRLVFGPIERRIHTRFGLAMMGE
jgi:NitT/TauT family transport system permease protein